MGQWVHRLSGVNPEARRAICANCGPVHVASKGPGRWRCAKAHRAGSVRSRREGKRGEHGLTVRQAREFTSGKSCAICGSKVRLVVDHCHKTGRIRGVLCAKCNSAIGLLGDDTERLASAIEYLKVS